MTPVRTGSRIGPFEIGAPVGSGGMGEVYRARDTRLGREVAIKVLPPAFAEDADRLARFEREARVLASLNHPNIAHVYGLEESAGTRAIVMELVPGPTLEDRIKEGPIPIDDVLAIAQQIVDALATAHEQGIVHRDLKPANVKVRADGTVKVLDFGLAKALAAAAGGDHLWSSPTITTGPFAVPGGGVTGMGMILGTAAYMAPEQAAGRMVDHRVDIWAFGVVVFEMLTGRRTFTGDSATEVMAAVLRADPEWGQLPGRTPASIRRLLRRCLAKDPKHRLQHIGDARLEITEALETPVVEAFTDAAPVASRWWHRPFPVLSAAVLVALGWLVAWGWPRGAAAPPGPVARYGVTLPSADQLEIGGLALSADGGQLVYLATRNGVPQLFRRSRDQLNVEPLAGTEHAQYPFISPDGQWVGFFVDRALKKVPLLGGPSEVIGEAGAPGGATWAADGTIVFAHSGERGLMRISDAGGVPIRLTAPGPEEARHLHPEMLPGGEQVLFTVAGPTPEVALLSLATGAWRALVPGTYARYAVPDRLVFHRGGSLWSVRFVAEPTSVVGEPVRVVDSVRSAANGLAHYALAADGTLVYEPLARSRSDVLEWVHADGRSDAVTAIVDAYRHPRVSPDGRFVAVDTSGKTDSDIWVVDLSSGTRIRLTDDGDSSNPVWSPDGQAITFARDTAGGMFSLRIDGSVEPAHLLGSAIEYPFGWSPDGRTLIFDRRSPEGRMDIWYAVFDAGDEAKETPFAATLADEYGPALSPDGRWLAYVSDESRRAEVYVERFPDGGGKRAISMNGGSEPQWTRDGRELVYREADRLLAVSVQLDSMVSIGRPREVARGRFMQARARGYDLSADGERVLVVRPGDDTTTPAALVVVQHWVNELESRVPRR